MGSPKTWATVCGVVVVSTTVSLVILTSTTVGSSSRFFLKCGLAEGTKQNLDAVWQWREPTPEDSDKYQGHSDTTGPYVPTKFRSVLEEYGAIDLTVDGTFPANPNVDALEAECGWDPVASDFKVPGCIEKKFGFDRASAPTGRPVGPEDVHLVVPTIRDLGFLEEWRSTLEGYDFIFVQDGDPHKLLKIPSWVRYDLYNRRDIERILGDRSWVISSRDSAIRNFGFLVSDRKFIYTLDDDCLPTHDIDALAAHLQNLNTPSTPYFFNTLYDPYAEGADFVRGYPYSLRAGVPTAISHGLWLNAPDYDAPTQLLKVKERNNHLVTSVHTVPHRQYYPMCGMNLAFNRPLIGAAIMHGLMGDGQPWARYDDMLAGWTSKACADHLRVGVKSGMPYIRHDKASNPFTNLRKEFVGLFWQEKLLRFFQALVVDPEARDAEECYLNLAKQIRGEFGTMHPYFDRLAKAMETWVALWREAAAGKLDFTPSRSSKDPTAVAPDGG